MKKNIYLISFLFFALTSMGQTAKISGRITDEKGEGLIQANIIIDASKGLATVTDFDGNYELPLPAGSYTVTYRYVGKDESKQKVTLADGEKKTINVTLTERVKMMDQVVVSGSKYEKKLSEETVSMDVIKGSQLNNQNITSLDGGVQKIPGITIADGQANIRGGSGWSYGAGSRVAILYDDLPITTADADDAKWSVIPMENVEQVEVIKGAASALYGSGALNGIINARSTYPTDKPFTKLQTYAGFYGDPPNKAMQWTGAGQLQYFTGMNLADRRKIGQVDLTTGFAFNSDRGYLDSSDAHDAHINAKIRWRVKKVEGLSVGINWVSYYSWGKTFFIFDSIGKKGYEPLPGTITTYRTMRHVVDPFINYYDKKDNKFSFKYRYLNSTNLNNTGQGSIGHRNYMEFQYQKLLKKIDMNIVTGLVGMYDIAASPGGNDSLSLVGSHNRGNFGIYAQVDKKFFKRLNVAAGVRFEYFTIDTGLKGNKGRQNSLSDLNYPLARLGINYQVAEATYIRASGGMGFRYPSIAEFYVQTQIGPIGVYSNPKIKPEKGYSAEIGIKQGFKLGKAGNWMGYGDAAVFLNQYTNFLEFTFGQFGPQDPNRLYGLGFSSQNIGNARIIGTEIIGAVQGTVGKFNIQFVAGYTFIDARNLNWNDSLDLRDINGVKLSPSTFYNNANAEAKNNDGSGGTKYITYAMTSSSKNNVLKYRPKHQFKFLMNFAFKKLDFNLDYQYLSYQENIDYAFVSPPFAALSTAFAGLKNYRDAQIANGSKGDHIVNAAIGFTPIPRFRLSFICKNLLNTEWSPRPGRFEAPRNYSIQLGYIF